MIKKWLVLGGISFSVGLSISLVINRNLKVIKTVYDRDKIPKDIDISMIPESASKIRIVEIKGFDIQPCGNAHVNKLSEIGIYKLIEIKRKGKDVYSRLT